MWPTVCRIVFGPYITMFTGRSIFFLYLVGSLRKGAAASVVMCTLRRQFSKDESILNTLAISSFITAVCSLEEASNDSKKVASSVNES